MIKNVEGLIKHFNNEIKKNVDIAVIGLSGGADSLLTAILCKESLGKENVYAVHMPYGLIDINTFNDRSKKIADYLKIPNIAVNIEQSVNCLLHQNTIGKVSKLTNGNTRARIRMTSLYMIAANLSEQYTNKKVRVINTCNLSESYIFYETKWGDGAGDIGLIGDLYKSEVYQLLDYYRDSGKVLEEHIDRIPSAGLMPQQTDEGELGHSYNAMEPVIKDKISSSPTNIYDKTDIGIFVTKRHNEGKHKQTLIPVIKVRKYCD